MNHSAKSGGITGISIQVCCMLSLELPHRNDSEYTQYTIVNIKRKITLNFINFAAVGFVPRAQKIEFETAVVNKPSSVRATEVLLYLLYLHL